jgi:hypothetical protein
MAKLPNDERPKLTKRQQVLFDRLVTLGDLAAKDLLPIKVASINGFGSFFRGKPSPKDADVVIQWVDESPQFNGFIRLIDTICGDVCYQQRFETPLAALLAEFDRANVGMLPGLIDSSEQRRVYESWLEGYSWHMLFPDSIEEQVARDAPNGFLRRLLRRTIPNVNVAFLLGPKGDEVEDAMRTGFLVEIWSPARPDMRANLISALSPDEVHRYLLEDLNSFQVQEFRIHATQRLLSELSRKLRYELSDDTHRGEWKWLKEEFATHYDGADLWRILSHNHLLADADITKAFGLTFTPTPIEPQSLAAIVEQSRERIKALWWQLEALRLVTHFLVQYRFGRGSQYLDETLEQYVLSALALKKRGKLIQDIDAALASIELPLLSAWIEREWDDSFR